MLGLILANRAEELPSKATLIVCPLSMLDQWMEEIRTRVTPRHLRVTVYYGSQRTKDPTWLENFDIVLTTYGTLAAEYVAPSKTKARSRPESCLASIFW